MRYPLCDTISKKYCAIWGVSRTGPLRRLPASDSRNRASRSSRFCAAEVHIVNLKFGSGVAPANQTEESEVRELSGKESGTGSGTPFACKCYTKPLKKRVPELIPDSFPESSRTSLSKCSKSRDLTAIAICDSNHESQITSDLRECEPSQKSSLL